MKRITYILAGLVLASSLFTSCGTKSSSTDNRLKVAGLIRNDKETFLNSYTSSLIAAAEEENVNLKVCISNDDAAIQIDQIKTMLTSGVKYFVITPVDTSITEQITKLIKSYGGACAFSNILPSDEALDVGKNFFYASSAEISAGDYQAEILDAYYKKNPSKISGKTVNIFYMNGEYGHTAQIFRRQGFMDGMKARGYTVNVVGEDGANWGYDTSRQIVSNFLPANGNKIDAIICQNDDMALGSVQALIDAGYVEPGNRDVDGDGTILTKPVIGVDATDSAKASIKEHKLLGTVLQDAKGQASTALELVIQCSKNGNAQGFTTKGGVSCATKVTGEAPLNRESVKDQIFLVPFVPVTE